MRMKTMMVIMKRRKSMKRKRRKPVKRKRGKNRKRNLAKIVRKIRLKLWKNSRKRWKMIISSICLKRVF
jgi:hypothetical protein